MTKIRAPSTTSRRPMVARHSGAPWLIMGAMSFRVIN